MDAYTPREVAKMLVKTMIVAKTAQITANTLEDRTGIDKDSKTAHVAGQFVGWSVVFAVKPYTDAAVDQTADWINARRAARAAKKNEPVK